MFAAPVRGFARAMMELHDQGADFACAAPHYRLAKDHFSRPSLTFHNRGADFASPASRMPLLVSNCSLGIRISTTRATIMTGESGTSCARRRDHHKRVSNDPFLFGTIARRNIISILRRRSFTFPTS